jgi:hypothetical protein
MEYLTILLVLSTAATIAAALVISALGDMTPRSFKISLYITSIATVILLASLVTWIEAGGTMDPPKYLRVEEPVYYRVDK